MRGKPFHTAGFTVEGIVHPFAERFGAIELEQVGGTGEDLQLLGRYISDINTVRIHYRLNNVPLLVNLFVFTDIDTLLNAGWQLPFFLRVYYIRSIISGQPPFVK